LLTEERRQAQTSAPDRQHCVPSSRC
jgi:hypothetical protein